MIKNNKILAYLYHMIKDNGLLWVIQRTYYEFLRKIKWHNWKFKSRCWKKDEFRLWLKPSISSDPDRYYKYWINNRPLYFFIRKIERNIVLL